MSSNSLDPPKSDLFLPPYSSMGIYIIISQEFSLNKSKEGESLFLKIAKVFVRFITSAAFLFFISPFIIFYNGILIIPKASILITSWIKNKDLFNHKKEEYIQDIAMHIFFSLKDILIESSFLLIAGAYALIPDLVTSIDKTSTNYIYNITSRI